MSARQLSVRFAVAVFAAAFASLAFCAGAGAAIVTVGSTLANQFESQSCDGECTVTQTKLPGATVTSPVDGTVIRWHLLGGTSGKPYRVRAFLPLDSNAQTTAVAGSGFERPTSSDLQTFATAFPIGAGQSIGLDIPEEATVAVALVPGSQYWYTSPQPPSGERTTIAEPSGFDSYEIGYNVEVLPPPYAAGIIPGDGTVSGGTRVTVVGANFEEVQGVSVGGVAVPFTLPPPDTAAFGDQLTFTTPPSPTLAYAPVSVSTLAGSSTTTIPFRYTGCIVPRLSHRVLEGAKKRVLRADCRVGRVRRKKGVAAKVVRVVKQAPKPGTVVPTDTRVFIKLG